MIYIPVSHRIRILSICGILLLSALQTRAGTSSKGAKSPEAKATLEVLGDIDDSLGFLNLFVRGESRDLYGLRIKEQYVDANGTTVTLQEDYPLWIDSPAGPAIERNGARLCFVDVEVRKRKDDRLWQEYVDNYHLRREIADRKKDGDNGTYPEPEKMEKPPVRISVPVPGKIRVFVSVYNKAGDESESFEIEGPSQIAEHLTPDSDYYDYVQSESIYQDGAADISQELDNAALLYYQAFISRPKPDDNTFGLIQKVLRGVELDKKSGLLIKKYLMNCRDTIRLAQAAALMTQCNWGVSSSHGVGSVPFADLRNLCYVLSLYARTLAADGHYRASLESSLMIRRLGRHTGETSILAYLTARAIDSMAIRTIQHILGVMPSDVEIRTWLRSQLEVVHGAPESSAQALQNSFEFTLDNVQRNPDLLAKIRDLFSKIPHDKWRDEELEGLTDEEFLARASKPYAQYLDSVVTIMDGGLQYEKKYNEIQRLEMELDERHRVDPIAMHMPFGGGLTVRQYAFSVRDAAHDNALKAAVEIYLVQARTGQLPTMLPEGLPKDPFSAKDFEYETTAGGFVLRCRGRDLDASRWEFKPGQSPKILSEKFQEYEFKVKK